MSKSELKNLKAELQNLLSEEKSGPVGDGERDGMPGAPKGGGPEADKGFRPGKPTGEVSKDDHSKPVKAVDRENGVNAAVKEFKPENTDKKGASKNSTGGTVKAVDRAEGAAAGVKEVGKGGAKQGSQEAVDKANTNKREEGSNAGSKEVGEYGDLTKFRSKVRSAFGLSLDDKMNKGNDGLNKK